jgi:hypothetical protein
MIARKTLLEALGLVVPPNRPEPDPRTERCAWVGWFRSLTFCDLRMAADASKRRQVEWDELDAATR